MRNIITLLCFFIVSCSSGSKADLSGLTPAGKAALRGAIEALNEEQLLARLDARLGDLSNPGKTSSWTGYPYTAEQQQVLIGAVNQVKQDIQEMGKEGFLNALTVPASQIPQLFSEHIAALIGAVFPGGEYTYTYWSINSGSEGELIALLSTNSQDSVSSSCPTTSLAVNIANSVGRVFVLDTVVEDLLCAWGLTFSNSSQAQVSGKVSQLKKQTTSGQTGMPYCLDNPLGIGKVCVPSGQPITLTDNNPSAGSKAIVSMSQDGDGSCKSESGEPSVRTCEVQSGLDVLSYAQAEKAAAKFDMATLRYDHTATLLESGEVLITGGDNFSSTLDTAELYDPETRQFTALRALMSTPRSEHTATLLESGKVLITGGKGAGGVLLKTIELYDPDTRQFTKLSALMKTARHEHTATLLKSGKILITGGKDAGDVSLNTTELYDPDTQQFTTLSALMKTARHGHTATLLESGEVLITGGKDEAENKLLDTTELYDPNSDGFTASALMGTPRLKHTATLLTRGPDEGDVLITGGLGLDEGGAELYDPERREFRPLAAMMTTERSYHAATSLESGKVLLTGGFGSGRTAELYNFEDRKFEKNNKFNIAYKTTGNYVCGWQSSSGGTLEDCDLGGDSSSYHCQPNGVVNTGVVCVNRTSCNKADRCLVEVNKDKPDGGKCVDGGGKLAAKALEADRDSICQFIDPCVKLDGTQNKTCTGADQYCYKGVCETAGELNNACKDLSGIQGSLKGTCKVGLCDEKTGLCPKCTSNYTGQTPIQGVACLSIQQPVCAGGSCTACPVGQSYSIATGCYTPGSGGGGGTTTNTPWGTTGIVKTEIATTDDSANAVSIQSDGKVVVAGASNEDIFLFRYNANGSPDTSFNSTGKVVKDISSSTRDDAANAIAIQSDGKILVAGSTYNAAENDIFVARYTSTGSLDTSFNTTGIYTYDPTGAGQINALAVSDGKIIMGGTANNKFFLARLTSAGTLDATFGTGGIVSTDVQNDGKNDDLQAIVIQSDGKIIAVGSSSNGTTSDTAIVRYTSAGALDTTFGTSGVVIVDVSAFQNDSAYSVALNSDNTRIVVGGYSYNGSDEDAVLLLYNNSGGAVTSFGSSGQVTWGTTGSNQTDNVQAVTFTSDGDILAAGQAYNSTDTNSDSLVRKYNTTNGALVTSFGSSGEVKTNIDSKENQTKAMAVQTDGKVLLVGTYEPSSGNKDVAVIRLRPNGALDAQ